MRLLKPCALVALSHLVTSCTLDHGSTGPSHVIDRTVTPRRASPDALPLTTVTCGALITSHVRLDNDLGCTGNALLVNGADIRIDLNGHTIAGTGTGNGLTVTSSHNVAIFGGVVKGFVSGVFVSNSTDIAVTDNEFTLNREAVLLQATSGSTIRHNVAWKNTARAFMIRPNMVGGLSTNNLVIGNLVTDTPTGIFLIRQPGNTIQQNTISGSSIAAIDLGTGSGTVSDNIVRANLLTGGGVGVRFGAGWTSNTFNGNRIASNVCGIQGSTAGNTLNGNVLSDNDADGCP